VNYGVRQFLKQPWLAQLALAVMLLHALVPAGFMPVASDGSFTLQLCSAFAPLSSQLQGDDAPSAPAKPDSQSDHSEQGACPYGGLVHAVLPTAIAHWLPLATVLTIVEVFDDRGFSAAPTPLSRLPRGPPASI
jgi:hypothetical protein